MTLSEIYLEIGSLAGDPRLESYEDDVVIFFQTAMTQLLKSADTVDYDDVMPLRDQVSVSIGNEYVSKMINQVNFPNLLLILNVHSSPNDNVYWEKTTVSDITRMKMNPLLMPGLNEGRWAKGNDKMHFILGWDRFSSVIIVFVDVIENPDPDSWGTNDLVSDIGFGLGFIKQCILLAAKLLRNKIGLEEI